MKDKLVKRLGFETLKEFLDKSLEMYDKYDEKAKEYSPGSTLIFERQGKNVVFYVEIKEPEEFIVDDDDDYEMDDIIFTK